MRNAKPPPFTLRYVLAPDAEGRQALAATFVAYARMGEILGGFPADIGGNLVTLHEQAYEQVREETGLPARLVTLGLRDFTAHGPDIAVWGLPLDDKLFAVKTPSTLTIATVHGRIVSPYDVAGYAAGSEGLFPARLVERAGSYEIHVGVMPHTLPTEEKRMAHEGILSRMGRLIAGIANAAVDKAEGSNRVAVVEQAIREIDQAADAARADLGKAKAEEFRIKSRRGELETERTTLDEKIRLAVSQARDDLAKGAIARQIDLESQVTALDKALADIGEQIAEGQQALQAVLATRREAEARLADLKRSIAREEAAPAAGGGARKSPADGAAKAASAVARATGVPAGTPSASPELDELDRLHREHAIAERLARFKSGA